MPIYQLDEGLWFPNPKYGEDDGLLAVGGDLSPKRLVLAYSNGIFPWFAYKEYEVPLWYCPMERYVIFPCEIHISHSMKQLINKGVYKITVNQDFSGVINGCSTANARNNDEGAWLGKDMIEAYTELHRMNLAMSVEVWEGNNLVGGLYGVCLNRVFCGESMFSLVPNASKLALIYLAQSLQQIPCSIIDCQFETPHLRSMGGRYITYEEYMVIVRGE